MGTAHIRLSIFYMTVKLAMQALLGDALNRRKLRQSLHKFVRLRRYEQMSAHQALQGLRLSELPFLWPDSKRGDSPLNQNQIPCVAIPQD